MHILLPLSLLVMPPVCCSLCDNAQLPQLFQMWAAPGRGTRREMLLLQASSSYFAVAPILRALQAGPRMGALDRYLLHTEPGQPLPVVAPPAYMAAPGAGTWDLWTPLVCKDKVAVLAEGERARWELAGALVLLLPGWCGRSGLLPGQCSDHDAMHAVTGLCAC